jgi:phosphoribosylformimino-5-aminoimidazole carboxamide ribotide isomerase
VRLHQGDFARETIYSDDPVAVARRFAAEGAPWLHVVDLDAARTGEPVNRAVVAAVARAVDVPVQSGGGVRDEAAAAALWSVGVARVVVGTAALEDPALVGRMAAANPGRVAVGLDTRGAEVAVRGWTVGSGEALADVLPRLGGTAVAAVVVTDIARDASLRGPDFAGLAAALAAAPVPVIASGGVGTIEELQALAALEAGGRRLEGAIVGRALYEERFTVAEAVAALA